MNNMHEHSCLQKYRQSIFWPGMTRDVTEKIKSCYVCSIYSDYQQKLPMINHEPPTFPFQTVSMNFCEVIYKNKYRNIFCNCRSLF